MNSKNSNIIWKNTLLLFNYNLLYFDQANIYQKNYFNYIKKYILYLLIIYQNLNNIKYAIEIIYRVAWFKTL